MIRIATRGSALARWQAERVGARLAQPVEYVLVSTTGDRDQRADLHAIGGTGVFTKEVQQAVLEGLADVAVHSAKDLPSETPAGLVLAAVPERGDPRDALVGSSLDDSFLTIDRINPTFNTAARVRRLPMVVLGDRGSVAALQRTVLVAPRSGFLTRIDARSGRVLKRVDPGAAPTAVAQGFGSSFLFDATSAGRRAMPNTQLPESKEKAHDIARKITNERPLKKDKDAPESQVTGGFNQKSRQELDDRRRPQGGSASNGDGQ